MSDRAGGTPRRSALRVRSKVWVEHEDGSVLISEYRAELLRAIREHGAVSAAAATLGLPYRTAWKKLDEMQAAAGAALIETASGGRGGGGTRLTPAGEQLRADFERLAAPLTAGVAGRFPASSG